MEQTRNKDGAAESMPVVQWFPGHMAKTRRLIEEHLKLVDVVFELLDARAPMSSANPLLHEIIDEKPCITILNKADLADEMGTQAWLAYYRGQGRVALSLDSLTGKGVKTLLRQAETLAREKTRRLAAKGGKPRAARAMALGIPNVGKSSLINRLVGAAKAKVENRPGVTRDKQWLRISKNLELLDMPGILWPKFDDPVVGVRLAFLGSVNDEIYDRAAISRFLGTWLAERYPERLRERYGISEEEAKAELLTAIGKRRGCLLKGGIVDMEKASRILLTDFRDGRLGRMTLDEVPRDSTSEETFHG